MIRRELKIPINKNLNDIFYNLIFKNIDIHQHFPKRNINSIYYDDFQLSNAINNINGLPIREKLRFRWYNNEITNIKLELKKKRNTYSYKEIFKINNEYDISSKYFNYFKLNNLYDTDKKIFNRFKILNYIPIIKISYTRRYFIYKKVIRITFDTNIKYSIISKFYKNLSFEDSNNIIEIKFEPKFYKHVLDLIKDSNFYPKRNSKYIKGLYLNGIISEY